MQLFFSLARPVTVEIEKVSNSSFFWLKKKKINSSLVELFLLLDKQHHLSMPRVPGLLNLILKWSSELGGIFTPTVQMRNLKLGAA